MHFPKRFTFVLATVRWFASTPGRQSSGGALHISAIRMSDSAAASAYTAPTAPTCHTTSAPWPPRSTPANPSIDQEVVVERPDGERLTVLVNIAALRDGDGRVNGAINCFQDITSRKQGEDGLRDSERKVRELIDALPAAVYVTDAEGRITMFNQAAVEFSGRVPELGAEFLVRVVEAVPVRRHPVAP